MRPRSTGISGADRPQQQPAQTFKPKSEWKHEEAASFLFVYLPGFTMDQLTVTPDYSNRTVKVEGSRRLPNSRLLPVDETANIPEEFDLPKMDIQFGRGVLMLKFPRNIVLPQQQTTDETMEEAPKPQETVVDSMTRQDEWTDHSTKTSTTVLQKQTLDTAVVVPPVATTVDEKSAMTASKSDEEELVERKVEKDDNWKPAKESRENVVQNDWVNEEGSKEQSKKSTMPSATAVGKVEEKKKEKNLKSANDSADAKAKQSGKENINAEGMKEPNEDRKLIINIGAAVLIIMGLGVSLFYTLGNKLGI
ncbi:uncharacterized protein LOC111310425 [Durio zibethinus]|uniref:Uncharacterized protein LOC111310425 n=1 Tax=Durio zibethinus TaxID=66656 RepID=A0A6P6AL65_DURZI|nr:uncharacterized protein LOC111310425 [Durio zibethinus]